MAAADDSELMEVTPPSPDSEQQLSQSQHAQQQQQQQPQPSLLAVFDNDAIVKGLRPRLRDRLRPSVSLLQAAIQSEMVAHVLTLFRYVRLQQQLMSVKRWARKRAAKQLNLWIAAAYEGHQFTSELAVRIKHDAHRLFDLFSEPAGDDEWWSPFTKDVFFNQEKKSGDR